MTGPSAPIADMATKALHLLIQAVDQIPPQGWDQPSNLAGWSLRDLVGHATGSTAKIVALVADDDLWTGPSEPADWACEDPAAQLRELAARLDTALPDADYAAMRQSPAGELPLQQALGFPVADLALHSWDVLRSLGRPSELPDDLLTLCRTLVDSLPDDMLRRPGAFGPAQPAPENATPTTALMAYLGRSIT